MSYAQHPNVLCPVISSYPDSLLSACRPYILKYMELPKPAEGCRLYSGETIPGMQFVLVVYT